ncbi:MAG: hypothetical protein DMG06_19040 [Acidobacteria bacterium]|nr:MAG: hypothetical protein DMG06_19040 [Acidobacteriota bacterium]
MLLLVLLLLLAFRIEQVGARAGARVRFSEDPMLSQTSGVYDGIILGAGHNSLVLQAYLSKAGLRIQESCAWSHEIKLEVD